MLVAETNVKGISNSSYFLHKVSVAMATVWWLVLPPYSLSIFHSSPFISSISLFEDPSWPLWFSTSFTHQQLFTCYPCLSIFQSLKEQMKKWKRNQTQGEVKFLWSINDARTKCRVFFCKYVTGVASISKAFRHRASEKVYMSFPLLVCKWTADTD